MRTSAFTPAVTAQIELAVIEAVNNVIVHAYQGQAGHAVQLDWSLGQACLQIAVMDWGQAPAAPPVPDMPDSLAENGRGWPIMLACMDDVDYRSQDGCNILTLTKQIRT
ncbi:MAG: ATP-binding protein [Candidatus Competibacteraceae bacterium]|nr:ATP-binding protein [Candidatus Competibacteraceae bacterium]